jgi:hypothetical protein
MNDLNAAIANANRVMSGEQQLNVYPKIEYTDMLVLAGFIGAAVFIGTSFANIITK